GFGRYTTEELDELIEDVFKAEAYKDQQRDDATRRVFSDFDSRRSIWSAVLDRVAQVDVLLSLARYCQTCGLAVCRPEFVYNSEKPFLIIEEGYHPCLAVSLPTNEAASACTYIANDSHLGGDHPPTVLLTGPNMGGKSTLMRQVAVLTVLAHMVMNIFVCGTLQFSKNVVKMSEIRRKTSFIATEYIDLVIFACVAAKYL
ncbi:MutS domain V protein, partial [Ancylostoma duodenale]